MAKQPTIDRFKISVESDAVQLGPNLAALNKMGLTVTGCELITDVKTYRGGHGTKGVSADLLREFIKDHPTFAAIQAVNYFKERGSTQNATYPTLVKLVELGELKKMAPGQYARADVKQIAAPKGPGKGNGVHKTFAKRGEDVMLAHAKRNHGRLNTGKLIEIFEKEGRAKGSVYGSFNKLLSAGKVKRVGETGSGSYVLLTKAATPKKARKKEGGTEARHQWERAGSRGPQWLVGSHAHTTLLTKTLKSTCGAPSFRKKASGRGT